MIVRFFGKISNGKFSLDRRQVFNAYVQGQKDGDYFLVLHKAKGAPKTLGQLGYYYAVIVPTVFRQMKDDGNETFVVKINKKFREVPLTTDVVDLLLKEACAFSDNKLKRNMSMQECSEFIDKCIKWAAKWLHCVIPPPETV